MYLCSNKIAWNTYASLQMISEYFSVRGRPLNHVKKPSSFEEFDKPAAILDFEFCWTLGTNAIKPMMQCSETRGWFQRSNDFSKTVPLQCEKSEGMMVKSNNICICLALGTNVSIKNRMPSGLGLKKCSLLRSVLQ